MVYVIIVLYKTKLEDSVTYNALKRNLSVLKKLGSKILIYNNSPEIEVPLSEDYIVHTPTENLMLAGAYNYALEQANKDGCKWLLLLDQDTQLTEEYFKELKIFLDSTENENYDVAVPVLVNGKYHLSPIAYKKNQGPFADISEIQEQKDIASLKHNEFVVAYNSVSLLSVSALNNIGGFGTEYKLDFLDYYYYYKLSSNNVRIYILPVYLNQNLSLLEDKFSMSLERYEDYLYSRLKFARSIGLKSILLFKKLLLIELRIFIKRKERNIYKKKLIKYLFKW